MLISWLLEPFHTVNGGHKNGFFAVSQFIRSPPAPSLLLPAGPPDKSEIYCGCRQSGTAQGSDTRPLIDSFVINLPLLPFDFISLELSMRGIFGGRPEKVTFAALNRTRYLRSFRIARFLSISNIRLELATLVG